MMDCSQKTIPIHCEPNQVGAETGGKLKPNCLDALALLIDFGSTFTKATVVNLKTAQIIGRSQAPSTVESDVSQGLVRALSILAKKIPNLPNLTLSLDGLDTMNVSASSSAAGGLRVVVAGLAPGLTVEAANAAALGAGAKVVGTYSFKLDGKEMDKIVASSPDLILLTGGMEGGDQATILHNAKMFAKAPLRIPIVAAGNSSVAPIINSLLTRAGKEVHCAANVLSIDGSVTPKAAQQEIRRLFMSHITNAKGLEKIKDRVPVILPTPMAVQKAALLGTLGTQAKQGLGELLLVDVGGATTDVYSVGDGKPRGKDMIPTGLPEPFSKRTVEGDLGLRFNARTILEQVGEEFLFASFGAAFPELRIEREDLFAYVEAVSNETDRVPSADWQFAADAIMARIAVDLAIARHVGRSTPYYAGGGAVNLMTGKDMTETPTVIGTGGIFTYNPFATRILAAPSQADETQTVLRPINPNIQIDKDYVLHAVGLLADSHPEVALSIFLDHFPLTLPVSNHVPAHQPAPKSQVMAGEDSCCS